MKQLLTVMGMAVHTSVLSGQQVEVAREVAVNAKKKYWETHVPSRCGCHWLWVDIISAGWDGTGRDSSGISNTQIFWRCPTVETFRMLSHVPSQFRMPSFLLSYHHLLLVGSLLTLLINVRACMTSTKCVRLVRSRTRWWTVSSTGELLWRVRSVYDGYEVGRGGGPLAARC